MRVFIPDITHTAVKSAWTLKQPVLMQQLVIVKNDRDVSVTDVRLNVTLSLSFVLALKRIALWESERQGETMHWYVAWPLQAKWQLRFASAAPITVRLARRIDSPEISEILYVYGFVNAPDKGFLSLCRRGDADRAVVAIRKHHFTCTGMMSEKFYPVLPFFTLVSQNYYQATINTKLDQWCFPE